MHTRNATLLLSCVLVILAGLSWWLLPRGYGKVNLAAYRYAQAIYSASNRRSQRQLHQVAERVADARDAGEISPQESRWLLAIVERAQRGDWEPANRDARRLMQAQIQR